MKKDAGRVLTMLARLGKRDGISADTAKGVEDRIAPTPFCDLVRDQLRRDAVPPFLVQQASFVIEGEIAFSLGEVCMVNDESVLGGGGVPYIFAGARELGRRFRSRVQAPSHRMRATAGRAIQSEGTCHHRQ